MPITFPHVEDYIELLAGYDPTAGSGIIFNTSKYTFSLARYDVSIVESMANGTVWSNQAFTDKQGELAIKLVLKYKRQFASQGIDISPVEEDPQWRIPLRKLDRSKRVWLEEGEIRMRFPYDRLLVDQAQTYKKTSQGRANWDHENKMWKLGLTEANVNWAVAWGELQHFDIDPELQKLYDSIIETESTPYEIKLVQEGDRFVITNAEPTLIEYVETKLGGFGLDNAVRLVDNAGVLGYSVHPMINYPELLDLFGAEREIHVPSTYEGSLDLILDYAELTNRYPICIYNPGTQRVDVSHRFKPEEIVHFDMTGKTKTRDYNYYGVKVVYANKIPKNWDYDISLLVSTVEMMYGGKRTEWLNRAEKVIYYSYTKLRENN